MPIESSVIAGNSQSTIRCIKLYVTGTNPSNCSDILVVMVYASPISRKSILAVTICGEWRRKWQRVDSDHVTWDFDNRISRQFFVRVH